MFVSGQNRNKLIFSSATALLAAAFTYFATGLFPYYPLDWRWPIVLAVVILWVIKPAIGVAFSLALYLLPIAYNSITLAMIYILGLILIAIAEVWAIGPYGFLVLAGTTMVILKPQLTILTLIAPLLAGFLGTRRGVVLAAASCFWAQMLASLRGQTNIGLLTVSTQTAPLISLIPKPVSSLLDFGWLSAQVDRGNIDTNLFSTLFMPYIERPILLVQVGLWAITAGIISVLLSKPLVHKIPSRYSAVAGGLLVLGVGYMALPKLFGEGVADVSVIVRAILVPAVLVALAAPVLEMAASMLTPPAPGHAQTKVTTTRKESSADTWNGLAGIDDIRDELVNAIESQFNPKIRQTLQRMSIQPTRGILLFGPPGTGKTRLARVIAHEAKAAFFSVSGTEFTSKWYGESEANLRRIFDEARQNRPSVLFFDELEAFLPKRTEMSRSDAPERGIVATFLAYTDGIGDMDGVLLVGATNHPELIDPAALRPGRFDKLIYVSPPGREARRSILERYLRDKSLAADVDLDKLAARLERFTGADIQAICAEAVKSVMQRGGRKLEPITMSDLETAIGGVKPSVTINMLHEYEAIADQYGRRSEKMKTEDVVAKPILSWDDVAGLDNVKEALREAIEMPLAHPELFKEYGVKPSKGVLLFGPPGCGKTFLAKVVASEAKAHFLHIKGPELLQGAVGQSETQLRNTFNRARENSPCVLFFDEIDALAGARGSSEASGTKILTQFLTEMDGVEELKGVIVVAATNRPDTLDPAMMRPGRLDRILYVPPPDHPARLGLLKKELVGKPLADDIDYEHLAGMTEGYSAADITAICNSAGLATAKEALQTGERQLLSMQRLQEQIQRTSRSLTAAQLATYEALRDQLAR